MQEAYLEITFRPGRALAAYYHLPRSPDAKRGRSRRVEPGLVIDFSETGEPLGIEITAPSQITFEAFDTLLGELGVAPVGEAEFAPLHAA